MKATLPFLVLALALAGCYDPPRRPDPKPLVIQEKDVRLAGWITVFTQDKTVDQVGAFDNDPSVGGPLGKMCATSYTPPAGCRVTCPNPDGSGVNLQANMECAGQPGTESGLWEAQYPRHPSADYKGLIFFNGLQNEGGNVGTFVYDKVNKVLAIKWSLHGSLFRLRVYAEQMNVAGDFNYSLDQNGKLTFACDDTAEDGKKPHIDGQIVNCDDDLGPLIKAFLEDAPPQS